MRKEYQMTPTIRRRASFANPRPGRFPRSAVSATRARSDEAVRSSQRVDSSPSTARAPTARPSRAATHVARARLSRRTRHPAREGLAVSVSPRMSRDLQPLPWQRRAHGGAQAALDPYSSGRGACTNRARVEKGTSPPRPAIPATKSRGCSPRFGSSSMSAATCHGTFADQFKLSRTGSRSGHGAARLRHVPREPRIVKPSEPFCGGRSDQCSAVTNGLAGALAAPRCERTSSA